MSKVLFISYDGMTDPLGQSQVIPYLCRLTKFGYQFTILSCEKTKNYSLYKREIEEYLEPCSIKWIAIPYHKNPPVFSTLFDIYQLKKKALKLHSREKFDIVHARPGMPALIALAIKKRFGLKFLNDIREFYADSRIDGNIWNKRKFLYKIIYQFFKGKEKEEFENSDGIVCLTNAAEKIIRQWPNYKKEIPLKVIPCSVDMNLFDPEKIDSAQKLKLKSELNINDDDLIISYLGSIGSWYLIDEMMQFFKILSHKIPSVKFLFISPQSKESLFFIAEKFNLPKNKILVKSAHRNEVPALLSLSEFSTFFIKPCYSKQSSSPTKHGEIMAMGIPVITNAGVGDVAEIVEESRSGIVLKEFSEEEFKLAANSVSKEVSFDKVAIRDAAKVYYDLEKAVKIYDEIYTKILKK